MHILWMNIYIYLHILWMNIYIYLHLFIFDPVKEEVYLYSFGSEEIKNIRVYSNEKKYGTTNAILLHIRFSEIGLKMVKISIFGRKYVAKPKVLLHFPIK